MWIDPIQEQEFHKVVAIDKQRFLAAQEYVKANPLIMDLTVAHTQKNPILSKSIVTTLAMMNVPPDDPSVEMLVDEAQANWVVQESEKWQEINNKYRDDKVTDDMHLSIIDILTGGYAPGGRTPKEVGGWSPAIWLIGTLDAIRETWNKWNPLPTSDVLQFGGGGVPYRAQGRIWRYYQDLKRYDDLLEKGYTPKQAQANIASLVNISEVPNLGRDMGAGEFAQNLDFLEEAIKFAGENYIWAAAKKVFRGEAVNMDRSKKFFFESVHHDKDPKYHELLQKMGGDEEKAKQLYYLQIGTPIKKLDGNGEINYLSIENPNKIQIFADRRTNYNDMNVTEYAARELMKDAQLTDYSWGRYETGQLYTPGSTPYKVMSGLLDFASALPAEYATGGLLNLVRVKQASRSVNVVNQAKKIRQKSGDIRWLDTKLEAKELTELINVAKDRTTKAGKQAFDKLTKEEKLFITDEAKALEWAINMAKADKYNGVNPILQKVMKADRTLKRKHGMFNGRLQGVFSSTAEKLMSTPEARILVKHFADSRSADLMTDPTLRNWINNDDYWEWVGRQTDEGIIADSLKQMMQDGYSMPKMGAKGAGAADDLIAIPGLPKGFSYLTNKAVRAVTGSQDFAMRSLGGVIGANIKTPFTVSRKTLRLLTHRATRQNAVKNATKKVEGLVDGQADTWDILKQIYKAEINPNSLPFKKYLGFSANFNDGVSPRMKALISELPGSSMNLSNPRVAARQLVNHMKINQYTPDEFETTYRLFQNAIEGGYQKQVQFTMDLMENDYNRIRRTLEEKKAAGLINDSQARGHEVIAAHIKKVTAEWNKKERAYWKSNGVDTNGVSNNIHAPGGNTPEQTFKMLIDGEEIEIVIPHAHVLAEMSENFMPFINQDMVDRVNSKLFYHIDVDDVQAWEVTGAAKQNLKNFFSNWKADGLQFAKKEYPGWIPTNNTMDDAMTKLLDFYTRKVFKPIVLMRPAFFTRIFMEEQFRVYAAGLDSAWNNPFQYMKWVFSHSEKHQAEAFKSLDSWDNIVRSPEHRAITHEQWTVNLLAGGVSKNKYLANYEQVTFGQSTYNKGLRETLFKLRNDPVARHLAREGGVTEDTIKWFIEGNGNRFRQELYAKSDNFLDVATKDEYAIAYLHSVENRIRQATGHNLKAGRDYLPFDPKSIDNPNFTNDLVVAQLSHTSDGIADEGFKVLRDIIADGEIKRVKGSKPNIPFLKEVSDGKLRAISKSEQKEIDKVLNDMIDFYGPEKMDVGNLFYDNPKRIAEGSAWKAEEVYDKAVNYLFDALMEKPLNYLNRSSTFKQYRWAYISNNFHKYNAALQQKFIQEAKAMGVPRKVVKQLESLQSGTAGKYGTDAYQTISDASKAFGLQATQDLLYDITKRHSISHKTRNIFPFPEVWFEMLTTWPKLLAENPKIIRRVQLGLKGGRGASGLGFTGDGFFAEDPNGSGETMFVYPFGGYMGNLIFGEDSNIEMSPRAYVTGVNLLGQGFVPGPTPLAGFALDKVLPETSTGDEVRSVFFGDFGPPTGRGFWDAIIPTSPSFQKFMAASDWNPVGSQSEVESMRASTSIEIYKLLKMEGGDQRLLAQGALDPYLSKMEWKGTTADKLADEDLTPDLIDSALISYANDKAKTTFLFRAMAQFVLPTGFSPRYYAKDINGKMWGTQLLAKEYQNMVQEHNNDHIAAYETFVREYGYEHGWLTTAKSASKSGKKAYTNRVLDWQRDNKEVLEQLPLSSFYLLPDSIYEERSYQEIIQQYNIGERETLSTEEFAKAANDTVGYFRYTAYKRKLEVSRLPEQQKDMLLRIYRTALIQELPGFEATGGLRQPATSKEILTEMINKWPELSVAYETEAGKAFIEEFLPKWKQNQLASTYRSPSQNPDWWLSSTNPTAVWMRADFQAWANELIRISPDFAPIWTNIISRMFRNDLEYYDVQDV